MPRRAIPVIGLNEGGYAYFGEQAMQIGWPHGWHGSDQNVRGVPGLPYYQTPSDLTASAGCTAARLYGAGTDMVSIHMPSPIAGVTPLAWEPADNQHAPLIAEERREVCNQLWGFAGAPSGHDAQRQAALHQRRPLRPGQLPRRHRREPEPGCFELFSPREIPVARR